MNIHVVSTLPFSREKVFYTYRDHLPDLVPWLPNIDKIVVASRTSPTPEVVALENHWYGKADIPRVARGFIKPDLLRWVDRARWNESTFSCEWEIELMFLKEAVTCRGRDVITAEGPDSARMLIEGDLSIDLRKVPGVPGMLSSLQPQVERFIVSLITPNFHTVNQGITRWLTQQEAAGKPTNR